MPSSLPQIAQRYIDALNPDMPARQASVVALSAPSASLNARLEMPQLAGMRVRRPNPDCG